MFKSRYNVLGACRNSTPLLCVVYVLAAHATSLVILPIVLGTDVLKHGCKAWLCRGTSLPPIKRNLSDGAACSRECCKRLVAF